MAPQRRDRHQGAVRYKRRFISRVFQREVQVSRRGHVEKRNLDRQERFLDIAVEVGGLPVCERALRGITSLLSIEPIYLLVENDMPSIATEPGRHHRERPSGRHS